MEFGKKLPFARDRVAECYFWIMGVYFEPHYETARVFMTKVIALTSIIDDIYDVYGTLDELRLFTHAIRGWVYTSSNYMEYYIQSIFFFLIYIVQMGY